MLDLVFGQASDPGKVRTNNEDSLGSFIPNSRHQARSHGYLFAVADGVGGLAVNRRANLTPHRRPILTPLIDAHGR